MEKANSDKIDELFRRGIHELIDPDGSLKKKLQSNPEKVIIKFGVDPTRPDIHLGHAAILRKLRAFQEIGAKVVFLVGDYTAQIGDPTGKSKVRQEIGQEEVEANMRTFLDQVGKILIVDDQHFSWIRNSDWFLGATDLVFGSGAKPELTLNDNGKEKRIPLDPNSLLGKTALYDASRMQRTHLKRDQITAVTLRGFLWTLRSITHARLIERDMFQERLKNNEELYMHEMLYPVFQGVDSEVIARVYGSCDLEVGGTDQMFNMLLGRDVMKLNKVAPQAVLSMKLLVGTDGKEKMSKSLDNYISIIDSPTVMFGKVMSIPDASIPQYFELAAYTPIDEIADIEKAIAKGKNPMDVKKRLAKEITAIYHGSKSAEEALTSFENVFQKGLVPEEIQEVKVKKGDFLKEVLVEHNIISSKAEFGRLVNQKAVSVLETKVVIDDLFYKINETITIRIGSTRFLKCVVD